MKDNHSNVDENNIIEEKADLDKQPSYDNQENQPLDGDNETPTVLEQQPTDTTSVQPTSDTRAIDNSSQLKIGKKAFILGFCILLALMIVAFVLTKVIPQGNYVLTESGEYVMGENGKPIFEFNDGKGIPFWRVLLAPFLVLAPSNGGTTTYLILFLLVGIGGVFNVLDKSGTLKYVLSKLTQRFKEKKLLLLAVIALTFMVLGSTVGLLEEAIPFVPIVIILCYSLGLDAMCGLAVTVLAAGIGFSAGVINPFTTIVAMQIGGLAIGQGIVIRLIVFVLCYGTLMAFLLPYAKKISNNPQKSLVFAEDERAKAAIRAQMELEFEKSPLLERAYKWCLINLALLAVFIVLSIFITALSSAVIIVIIAIYFSCGIGAGIIAKTKPKSMLKQFCSGAINVAPAIFMILMAVSVKYIIDQGGVMDSILYYTVGLMDKTPKMARPLLLYLVVLVLNFFISSGSAKAQLLMPILYPISDLSGINRVVTLTAFLFGDGFSNMIFPTNAVLLIALSLSTVNYGKWIRWTAKIQLTLLAMSIAVLLTINIIL